MDLQNEKYIKRLLLEAPKGAPLTSKYLNKIGISRQLIKVYEKSGWIESMGHGVYCFPNSKVTWEGMVYALQDQLERTVTIGGRAALEYYGMGHFLSLQKQRIFLFQPTNQKTPKWIDSMSLDNVEFVWVNTNMIPVNTGVSKESFQHFELLVSTPERAALEVAYLVGKHHSFEEFVLLSESLGRFRPKVIKQLLITCRSKYAKRLILMLGDFQGSPWFKRLDKNEIDIGSGVMQVEGGGHYVSQYLLSIPKPLNEYMNV